MPRLALWFTAIFLIAPVMSVVAQPPAARPGFIVPPTSAPPNTTVSSVQRTAGLRDALDKYIAQAHGLTPQQRNDLLSLQTSTLVEKLTNHLVPSPLQPPSQRPAVPFFASTAGGGGPVAAHPGVALLLVRDINDAVVPWCTGTLISPTEIVTAAHCVCPPDLPDYGYTDFKKCNDGVTPHPSSPYLSTDRWTAFFQHAGTRTVVNITVDESYSFPPNGIDIKGDLAILRLDHSIPWISPAVLAPSRAEDTLPEAWGVGFGWSAVIGSTRSRV